MGGRLSLYGLVIVGAKPNVIHSTHSHSSLPCILCQLPPFAACLSFSFFLLIPPFFCTFFIIFTLSPSLSLCPTSRISLSLFWGSHCISKHVLNLIIPTYCLPAWCLSCLASCRKQLEEQEARFNHEAFVEQD